ncbi:hypothetical protein BUALT_Bualt05G0041900 [Buddleja alternifolia]|uniref:NTF2 domain-containing protein n=1 Tax=Buddleja alternifolia TaxID=168488 RepID=A0AAV6XGC2_9LAMI|nr:hypothetical protein BUALT_Bualt05G0041900 [Buddleja alternifolia]
MAVATTTRTVVAALTPQLVSPQFVGNAFVQLYILHHSLRLVHQFYQDISKLGHPTENSMSISTTIHAIKEIIVSLNYVHFKVEIKSVDAKESFNGGVHVLVTGYLTLYILHHLLRLVYRFYQDISKLGHPKENGSMSISTTMQSIKKNIVSLNYVLFRAEIKSVDAQESFNGGVHILVTGYLTVKDNKYH